MARKRPNGYGSYINRGGRHIIQWTQDGRRNTKSFKSELEARQALEEIRNGTYKSSKIDKNKLNLEELFNIWIDNREKTPYNYGCKVRFKKHWAPIIGKLRPNELNIGKLKESITIFKQNGLSKATSGLLFRILSSFLSELVEDGLCEKNYVSLLSKKSKKDLIFEQDPAKTPFIKNLKDIEELFTWLDGQNRSAAIAFALGSLAGLRIGEIRALNWNEVDFNNRLIHVKWQAGTAQDGPEKLRAPKNGMSRSVPMSDNLYTLLQEWFEKVGHTESGLVVRPPYSPDPNKKFIGKIILKDLLRQGMRVLKIKRLNWHRATRHTFASHYILNGGSLMTLKEILGHSSYQTTERNYVHLTTDRYSEKDRNILDNIQLREHERPVDFRLKQNKISKIDTRSMLY